MSNDIGSDNENFEDSYFDDAIIEIANEIEQLKTINLEGIQKGDPPIVLNIDREMKKVQPSSINTLPAIKTLQEEKIPSTGMYANRSGTSSTIEQKYYHSTPGSNKQYHPLIITETSLVSNDTLDYHNLTFEDLFEDPKPDEKLSVMSPSNPGQDSCSLNEDLKNQHSSKSDSKLRDTNMIKTVHTPNNITYTIR